MAWVKGQSGNPKGRPKGARHKFSELFLYDLANAWKKHGIKALEETIKTKPTEFVRVAAAILPKIVETTVRTELDGMSDVELKAFIQREMEAAQANGPLSLHEPIEGEGIDVDKLLTH
jgi:hypothetical protein